MQTTARNATMGDLAAMLTDQQARKIDLVVPATKMYAEGGLIKVTGTEPTLTEDGVTLTDGTFRPTAVFDEGVAEKFSIPLAYVRRLRNERPDLWDANVNGWLYGAAADDFTTDPDPRSFLLRGFKPDTDGGEGIARALLSDRYGKIDHLDALTAALDGVRQAGAEVDIVSADLTDRRMVVRVAAPAVTALAPTLLAGYRSPFTGASGTENPTVFAGFEIANSETGGGAYTITPRMIFEVCSNGMKITKDAVRAVHVGGRLDEGTIRWSADTHRKALDLIRAKTADAVTTFLDVDYMTAAIDRLSAEAGKPVEKVDEVKQITKSLSFTQEETDSVLAHFIKGGQMTVGGVANAITAAAQEQPDGDTAYAFESRAASLLGV